MVQFLALSDCGIFSVPRLMKPSFLGTQLIASRAHMDYLFPWFLTRECMLSSSGHPRMFWSWAQLQSLLDRFGILSAVPGDTGQYLNSKYLCEMQFNSKNIQADWKEPRVLGMLGPLLRHFSYLPGGKLHVFQQSRQKLERGRKGTLLKVHQSFVN